MSVHALWVFKESSLSRGKRKTRLIFFLPSFQIGGAEKVVVDLAGKFAGEGFSVGLAVLSRRGGLADGMDPRVKTVNLALFPKSKMLERLHPRLASLLALPRIIMHLRRQSPGLVVVSSTSTRTAVLLTRLLFGRRFLYLARIDGPHSANHFSMRGGSLLKAALLDLAHKLDALVFPLAHALICVSKGVEEDARKHLPEMNNLIRTIYNPVPVDDIIRKSALPAPNAFRESQDPVPVVTAVGRLVEGQRDTANLLRAFAIILRARPARLLVIGDGPDAGKLKRMTEELGMTGHVRFLGPLDNPFPLMARSDVFALSSMVEGMPTALVEAMACGTPVVATDCLAGPREILEGGRHGPLVPVGDEKAMARAILDVLDNPPDSRALVERARFFSMERAFAGHLELARELGAGGGP